MFVAFMLEAFAVFLLLHLIDRPVYFIVLSGLCFFAWGEIFSLFPSIIGDLFGRKWCTANYGVAYRQGRGLDLRRTDRGAGLREDRHLGAGVLGDDCVRRVRRLPCAILAEAAGGESRSPRRRRPGEGDARSAGRGGDADRFRVGAEDTRRRSNGFVRVADGPLTGPQRSA